MVRSSSLLLLLLLPLLCFTLFNLKFVDGAGTDDGTEQWGYVQVRPKAHMFWWYYKSPQRIENGSTPWPLVLWLQGGPGASGIGIGNFQEIGPLDTNLKPRSSTWLQRADLLFVDNPVGTGYSFVEDNTLLVTTDEAAAVDLTTLLKELYNSIESLQKSPLFIVAESYGGKFAVTLGLSVAKAIKSGELKLKLGGVVLGDSWISPEDFVLSWGPLLLDVSRLDINGADKSNSMAEKIKAQIAQGLYADATNSWSTLEGLIISSSNSVDFYNFLLDSGMDPLSVTSASLMMKSYSSWVDQSDAVFNALTNDFMKPRIDEVDELLSLGVNVTIYNGQLDVICATKGTEAWVQKLKWEGLKNFISLDRTPLYCSSDAVGGTKGFVKSYRNLHFYWILKAGHFVPVDQPCVALNMLSNITQSPAISSSYID
ncbi:serine carboxypeptidase-like 51 isoform X2 [Ananas comosus]|uniref:Carboxypeptidase n=1 Tax=Ananas comosus TaxID=4615 RepID=A0A6P5G730_ANACO|nr:serine carboxypeptidase-like 51 isoform X2 [Ananas comosus]